MGRNKITDLLRLWAPMMKGEREAESTEVVLLPVGFEQLRKSQIRNGRKAKLPCRLNRT